MGVHASGRGSTVSAHGACDPAHGCHQGEAARQPAVLHQAAGQDDAEGENQEGFTHREGDIN